MFHITDRPARTLSTYLSEKRSGVHLVEAHDWMGPASESAAPSTETPASALPVRLSGNPR